MLTAALDLLAPSRCAGCRTVGPVLCPVCARRLAVPDRQHRSVPTAAGPLAVTCAHPYDPLLRALLVAVKERGRRGLVAPLGVALAAALDPGPVLLVPVPSRGSARRSRGFDHTLALARAAAAARPGVGVWSGLRLRRPVRDSAGLDAAARRANLHGAMVLRRGAPTLAAGTVVCLVDDVCTTGTSLAEAARAVGVGLPGVPLRAAAVASVASPAQRRTPPQDRPDGSCEGPPRAAGKV